MRDRSDSEAWLTGERYRFREYQRFRQWWVWALVLLPALGVTLVVVIQVGFGIPVGSKPAPDGALLLLFGVIGLGLPLLIGSCLLRTTVESECLEIRFRPFTRRRIPLDTIRRAEAVTYSPVMDYGGWGIKWSMKGWCYNVSGNRGVEVHLTDGKMVMIGSQRAEELAAAIEAARAVASVR